jgi:hypothetical protein
MTSGFCWVPVLLFWALLRRCHHLYKRVLTSNVVEVSAGDPKEAQYAKAAHCLIAFVALDDQGASAEIEHWRPEKEEDAALEQYATSIMGPRKGIEEVEMRLREATLP